VRAGAAGACIVEGVCTGMYMLVPTDIMELGICSVAIGAECLFRKLYKSLYSFNTRKV